MILKILTAKTSSMFFLHSIKIYETLSTKLAKIVTPSARGALIPILCVQLDTGN
jgi:hypothetical protein